MTDSTFIKRLVWINGAIPAALLAYDASQNRLGANPSNFALLTTGILALFFLSASLAVTPLRKLTGFSWLIFSRRALGLLAFFHAAAHLVLYVISKHAGNIPASLREIFNAPYLVIGLIALLAMLPLALTSTAGMVKRLGAKRWQRLHRLAYVAGLAAAVHFCLQGKFVRPLAWLYLAVISTLLAFRAVLFLLKLARPAPAPARWTGQLRIHSITRETPNVQTFRLVHPTAGKLPFSHLPGQYLNLTLAIDGQPVYRCYTIASSPSSAAYCELTTKREDLGHASRHMHDQLTVGSLLSVSAPAGSFTFNPGHAPRVALLAAGVGITPLMSILRHLTESNWPGTIYLLYANKTQSDIIFRDELQTLARQHPNFHLTLTLTRENSPDWTGRRGRIDADLLTTAIPNLATLPIYICGPAEMIAATRQLLADLHVPAQNIHTESFGSRPTSPLAADPNAPTFTVTFARSQKTAPITAAQSILELAESLAIPIPFECRSGICGTCKCSLLAGSVAMATTDALTPADRAANKILPCQAHPTANTTIDA